MPVIVRKNIVTVMATFTAADGTATQPSAAQAIFTYRDRAGDAHTVEVGLTYNSTTNMWVGTWDSSASGEGTVFWMIWGYGTLQAASEGSFEIAANPANVI